MRDENRGLDAKQANKTRKLTPDEQPGVLYFADYPDPTSIPQAGNAKQLGRHEQPKTPVNSRMIVHLKNETKLPSMLISMLYKFVEHQDTQSAITTNTKAGSNLKECKRHIAFTATTRL